MRNILVKLQNMITRVHGDRPGGKPQVAGLGDSVAAEIEVFEPQGVHFVAPADAQGVRLAPNGVTSVGVVVGYGGAKPEDGAVGEGGLHFLGVYKIYLATDGTLHLGQKDPSDFVALASKVDAAISALQSAFDAHTHTAPGGLSPAPTSPPLAPVGPQPSAASTAVKCL